MPQTSGISAIGIWMIACVIMVFGTLTEYGVILYIMMIKPWYDTLINRSTNSVGSIDDYNNYSEDQTQHRISKETARLALLKKIDCISAVMFPILFFSFCIVYLIWIMT